jgi:hypothetical protein
MKFPIDSNVLRQDGRSMTWRAWRDRIRLDPAAWWLALAALVAYAPGVWWGLPHATSEAGKHGWDVDGIGGIVTLSELHNFFVEAKPDWYVVYPPFHYLLLGCIYLPYLAWLWLTGDFTNPSASYPWGFSNPVAVVAALSFVARLVTLAMAAGTVVATYLTGRLVWDRTTGILAALAVMLAHPMFYYSRTSNLDVPVLFWMALGFWIAAKMLRGGATIRLGIWLGAAIALAVATKDQAYGPWAAGSIMLLFLCYRQAARQDRPWSWRPWLVVPASAACVYAVAGGVLLSPYRFAAHVRFLADFTDEAPIVQQLPEVLRPLTLEGVWILARENAAALVEAVGPVLPIMALVGFFVSRKSAFIQVIAAAVLGYLILVLLPVRHVQYRYVMFLVYALAFPSARALVWCLDRPAPVRAIAAALFVAAGVHLGARGTDLTYQMIFDARRDAGAWLAAHAEPGTRLAYFGLLDQLPALPPGLVVMQTSADTSVEAQWVPNRPDLVLVSPDFSSSPGMTRSLLLPEEVYQRLQDGSIGYRQVARFMTEPLFGGPLTYFPYVNSPVEIYARTTTNSQTEAPRAPPAAR